MTEKKPTLEYVTPLPKARVMPRPLKIRWWLLVMTMAAVWGTLLLLLLD